MQLICPHCSRTLEITGDPPTFCAYCGQSLSARTTTSTVEFSPENATRAPADTAAGSGDRIPETIGGYRLVRQIGRGGMGTVHEAMEIASGRHVAVKLISRQFAGSRQTVERFRQEGRLASLITHPRCVFVLAAEEEAGQPYIVMELMPGATLQELVERKGPLPIDEAVAKILDVIEGLQEAHRLGVIHRDVKPSNCFIEADGRVKIGDFGLSKSLAQGTHLTRTGSFLGTPLYASPEQVKAETVDEQSDVYSVAATLYFLLTGKAPHQVGDAAATLARIVSETAPSMRNQRPEVPAELDDVVLHGLERQRDRRLRNLSEFREALLPFLPGQLSFGSMGMRFGAYMIDVVALKIAEGIGFWALVRGLGLPRSFLMWLPTLAMLGLVILYFTFLEGLWGWSLGKLLMGLRVRRPSGNRRPGLGRSLVRAATLILLLSWGSLASIVMLLPYRLVSGGDFARLYEQHFFIWLQSFTLPWIGYGLGSLICFCSARARNGYRGLHEFLSGTRVVSLPPHRRRLLPKLRCSPPILQHPAELPASIGPYEVEGALRWTEQDKLLVGEDLSLGRKVWIWLRPNEEPFSDSRRKIARLSRLRCLSGGTDHGSRWDAFVAPSGALLSDLISVARRLTWSDVRPLLEELTEELVTATEESTLPGSLSVNQVWIEPNGHVQLLDMPGPASAPRPRMEKDNQTPLGLVRAVATLALEGQEREPGKQPGPIRAPLPGHARRLFHGLLANPPALTDVQQVRDELRSSRDMPDELTRSRRTAHVTLLATLLSFGLIQMFLAAWVPGLANCWTSYFRGRLREHAAQMLPALDASDLMVAYLQPVPFDRVRVVLQVERDADQIGTLQTKAAEDHRLHEAILQALNPLMRSQEIVIEQGGDEQIAKNLHYSGKLRGYAGDLSSKDDAESLREGLYWFGAVVVPLVIGFWPAVWIIWSFLTRGGLSFGIMGIRLVGGRGQPAPRWRCGWRALLVWTPLTGLLLLSMQLETAYWAHWFEDPSQIWMLWGASVCWWGAFALLLGYAVLALWFPARGLHDRLAGTYLVPR